MQYRYVLQTGFLLLSLLVGMFGIATAAEAGFIVKAPTYLGLTSGLVGFWSFNQADMAGTQAYDRSGQDNDGTLTNGPRRAIGRVGQALDFDGTDDYVSAGTAASIDLDTTLTICVWFKADSLPGSDIALVANDLNLEDSQYKLETRGTSLFLSWHDDSPNVEEWVTATGVLGVNRWHHACAVRFSVSSVKIYVDSVDLSGLTNTGTGVVPASAGTTAIGRLGQRNVDFFDGLIDEVRIYNRTLSAQEVTRLYNIGNTFKTGVSQNQKLTNGLVGLWSFDQADMAGTLAYDRSGTYATGTLTNGPRRAVGRMGQALEFDGTDDSVAVSDSAVFTLDPAQSYSWSFWIKPDGMDQWSHVVAHEADTSNLFAIQAHTIANLGRVPEACG